MILDLDSYDDPIKGYIICDYMKLSVDKCKYGNTVFYDGLLLNLWIPATRNADAGLLLTSLSVPRPRFDIGQ